VALEVTVGPRVKASVLWGLIGLLAFLVALQGYELITGYRYSLAVKAATALAVGVGATGASYLAEKRLFE
jgi:purine-cytosine permease-like protein